MQIKMKKLTGNVILIKNDIFSKPGWLRVFVENSITFKPYNRVNTRIYLLK